MEGQGSDGGVEALDCTQKNVSAVLGTLYLYALQEKAACRETDGNRSAA
jgi:hypothetical protein